MSAPVASPSSTPPSLVEDYIDIWFNPSAVFARRATQGTWGPFLVTTLLLIALYYASMGAMQGIFDAEIAKAISEARADNPSMNDEQVASMQRVMEMSLRYSGLIAMPVVLLLVGTLTFGMARGLGGSLSFGGGVMVASFAYLPKALDFLSLLVQSLLLNGVVFTGRFQHTLGVGRFLDPSMHQGLYNLLGRLDLFTIWTTVLLSIGLVHAGKVDRSKAVAAGVGLWLLGALPALFQLLGGG